MCKSTLTKQDIGQMNIFQNKCVYVKMIQTLHKDYRADILKAAHYLIVHYFAKSVELQSQILLHGVSF